jgi:hypothetical protein
MSFNFWALNAGGFLFQPAGVSGFAGERDRGVPIGRTCIFPALAAAAAARPCARIFGVARDHLLI